MELYGSLLYDREYRDDGGDDIFRPDSYTTWYKDTFQVFINRPNSDVGYEVEYFSTKEDFEEGDKIFVVYAIYGTGDSLGFDDHVAFEILGGFHSKEDAEKLRNVFLSGDVNKIGYIPPWEGYFEDLSEIGIFKAKVQKDEKG